MITSSTTSRKRAIEWAKNIIEKKPVYLDTETTGLEKSDEIIEISIIDDDCQVLFSSLVKPSRPIPSSSTFIHGITDDMVRIARTWPVIWPDVRAALFGREAVVMYNAEFDMRMMQQSHARYRLQWRDKFNTADLLALYAEFRGDWDPRRGTYRRYSLADAGIHCRISLPNAHRSTADALLTRKLLHYIAGCAA